jgi:hypothetical protein
VADLKQKIALRPKNGRRSVTSTLELFFRQQALLKYRGHMLAPKFGTKPNRLTPPVRPVSLNGLTGGASYSRSGNGHTGLTGGPDRWTPSPSRIVESLRISSCKRIPCGPRPPHPINIKAHDRLRWHHPIDHYFLQFLFLKP